MAVDQALGGVTLERLLLVREIEEVLYHEADLLDDRQFEAWLDMLTDDIRYWMPMRRNVKFDDQESENARTSRHELVR